MLYLRRSHGIVKDRRDFSIEAICPGDRISLRDSVKILYGRLLSLGLGSSLNISLFGNITAPLKLSEVFFKFGIFTIMAQEPLRSHSHSLIINFPRNLSNSTIAIWPVESSSWTPYSYCTFITHYGSDCPRVVKQVHNLFPRHLKVVRFDLFFRSL